MPDQRLSAVVVYARRLLLGRTAPETDARLLDRFIDHGDEAAFASMMERLDTMRGRLPKGIREVATKSVSELRLPDQKKVAFWVRSGSLTADEKQQLRREINELGEELGSIGGYLNER